MSSTNSTQFNTTLREFLTKLINIFPQTETDIKKHYRALLENSTYTDLEYCKDFMTRSAEYRTDIAQNNEELFRHPICLFPGIDFEVIWNSDFNTSKTKKSIWIYLNVFSSLGDRVLEEERKNQEQINNMSDEDKMMLNLQKATEEYTQDKLSSKDQLLRTLTDKELTIELERRKQEKSDNKADNDDEEDLLNFDPAQGYSMMNAIKGITGIGGGNSGDMFGGLGNIMEMLSKTLGIDLGNFDLANFDVGNIGNLIKDIMTPENIEKVQQQVTKLASEFQNDLDSGNIDKSEITNIFDTMKQNFTKMATGKSGDNGENNDENGENNGKNNDKNNGDMMEQMMQSTQQMFSNMIPPHMRGQFEKIQREVLKDPSKLAEMMQNPEAMAREMMGGDSASANRFNSNTRNQQARNKLAKKYEEKQKLKQCTEEESVPIALPPPPSKNKNKNKKKYENV